MFKCLCLDGCCAGKFAFCCKSKISNFENLFAIWRVFTPFIFKLVEL